MRTYDITLTISPKLVVWPSDLPVELKRVEKIEEGSIANVTRMNISVHTGTHIDAPYHFINNGDTVENVSLNLLIGRAYVLHIPDESPSITKELIENSSIPPRTKRVLFRTKNSKHWEKESHTTFDKKYVALEPDAAELLIKRGVKLIGVDYLSVAAFDDVAPTHKILLSSEIIIVEGLDLSEVSQGRYTLYCLPLKLAGADGAPARVILTGV
jgi:arylformamidase